jgi:hypothetical protein
MIRNAKPKTRIALLARTLLANQPHVHRRHAAALRANHDRVDLHVGEMLAVRKILTSTELALWNYCLSLPRFDNSQNIETIHNMLIEERSSDRL